MNSQANAATFATVQAYIDDMNKGCSAFELADADHFASAYGITTPMALEDHLFWGGYSDWHKNEFGCRPRWMGHGDPVEDRARAESDLNRWAEMEQDEEESAMHVELWAASEERWARFQTA